MRKPLGVRLPVVVASVIVLLFGTAKVSRAESASKSNKEIVQASFDRWRAGTGGPFELLDEKVRWTIVGSSPASKTYKSKEQFMAEVIRPFNARMEEPLKPAIRSIHADGETVVVLFDAESKCIDGKPYRNTYAWFLTMKDGRVNEATAFFDTRLFDEMWTRVQPK